MGMVRGFHPSANGRLLDWKVHISMYPNHLLLLTYLILQKPTSVIDMEQIQQQ